MDTKKSLRAEIRSLHLDISDHRSALSSALLENAILKDRVSELIEKLKDRGRETRDRALTQAINSVTRLGAVDVVELARSYEAYLSGVQEGQLSSKELDFTNGMEEAGYSVSAIEDVIRMAPGSWCAVTDDIKKLIARLREDAKEVYSGGGYLYVEVTPEDAIAAADALEAEASKVKQLEARQARWAEDTTAQSKAAEAERDAAVADHDADCKRADEAERLAIGFREALQKSEAERDALRTAIQEALESLEENEDPDTLVIAILSRAIDTKEIVGEMEYTTSDWGGAPDMERFRLWGSAPIKIADYQRRAPSPWVPIKKGGQ